MDTPHDGNQHCDVISIKKSVHFWLGSCKMILHAPSQPFFHNLSLMNLDIVSLEYGHDGSSYMKVYTLHQSYNMLETQSQQ